MESKLHRRPKSKKKKHFISFDILLFFFLIILLEVARPTMYFMAA